MKEEIQMIKKIWILLVITMFMGCQRTGTPVANIGELQKRIGKLQGLDKDLESRRHEFFLLVRQYNATRPEPEHFDVTLLDTLMGTPERELLHTMFRDEKDISYSGIVKAIIEKNHEIAELQDKMSILEAQLPKPYIVKPGDTHFSVVMAYLMSEHGISRREAFQTVWKTALVDEILPGNEIWLLYRNGALGSYVTQGSAKVAPMTVHVQAKKRLMERIAQVESLNN